MQFTITPIDIISEHDSSKKMRYLKSKIIWIDLVKPHLAQITEKCEHIRHIDNMTVNGLAISLTKFNKISWTSNFNSWFWILKQLE